MLPLSWGSTTHDELGRSAVGRATPRERRGDRVITWAHASESADPTQYLSDAELFMTMGMNTGATATEHFDYLARLSNVGLWLAFKAGEVLAYGVSETGSGR